MKKMKTQESLTTEKRNENNIPQKSIFNGLKLQAVVSQADKTNVFNSIFTVNTNGSAKFVRKAVMAQIQALTELTGRQLGVSKGKKFELKVNAGNGLTLLTGIYFHNRGQKADLKFWREIKAMLNVSLPEIMSK